MFYIILQALFAAIFGLIIKWVGNRNRDEKREDILVIGAINYIVAAVAILPIYLNNDVSEFSQGAAWSGGAMGAIYFIAFFLVIYAVKWVGVSATTVVSVLSILAPITFAAFYWDEQPTTWQIIGIGLALLALTLIGGKKGGMQVERPWFAPIVLFSFFVLCGGSRLAQEAFKHVSSPEHKPTFLIVAFVIASIPSVILLLYINGYKRQKLMTSEIWIGIGLGLSNILQSHFILKCLDAFPGYIVFPVTSAGAVLFTTAVATGILGERLNLRTYIGISITVVALFLLNWS